MQPPEKQNTLLVLSQVYVPDPASVGQHVHDAAAEMARRGWRVVVLTSARGYDEPTRAYPHREMIDGVEVRRLPLASLGKRSILLRLLGQLSFLLQAIVRGAATRGVTGIFISTSPPMCSFSALVIGILRRVPIAYWVMDINPDQALALGVARPGAPLVRALDFLNCRILRRAAVVVTLDRFMAERLEAKADLTGKLTILPPWPHDDHLEPVEHERNPFRDEHGLSGKRVIMYSGNHSPTHPLDTVLEAALRLRQHDDLLFLFIGGGAGKADVERFVSAHALSHVRSLPYQPLDRIRYSLSAADVHLVSVGDASVGCVHPCKVYGAMAVARPVLLLGPDPCHVSELLREEAFGWHVRHGDVDAAVRAIEQVLDRPTAELREMGERARSVVTERLSKEILCPGFCDVVEQGLQPAVERAVGSP